ADGHGSQHRNVGRSPNAVLRNTRVDRGQTAFDGAAGRSDSGSADGPADLDTEASERESALIVDPVSRSSPRNLFVRTKNQFARGMSSWLENSLARWPSSLELQKESGRRSPRDWQRMGPRSSSTTRPARAAPTGSSRRSSHA